MFPPEKSIKLKRVYDPPSKDYGKRILVDRRQRGFRKNEAKIDEWLNE